LIDNLLQRKINYKDLNKFYQNRGKKLPKIRKREKGKRELRSKRSKITL
jgi:hypothetical protein